MKAKPVMWNMNAANENVFLSSGVDFIEALLGCKGIPGYDFEKDDILCEENILSGLTVTWIVIIKLQFTWEGADMYELKQRGF